MLAAWLGRAGMGVILLTAFFVEWLLPAWFEAALERPDPGQAGDGHRRAERRRHAAALAGARSPATCCARSISCRCLYGVGLVAMLANIATSSAWATSPPARSWSYTGEKSIVQRNIPDAQRGAAADRTRIWKSSGRCSSLPSARESLTQERLEELAELPRPLVGNLDGTRAAARLIGMANHIAGRQIRQAPFEAAHAKEWQEFEAFLESKTEAGRSIPREMPERYRRLCYALALAQDRRYSPDLVDRLNRLALRGHHVLYENRRRQSGQVVEFVLGGFARLVRAEWRFVAAAALLFFGPLAL